MKTRLKKYLNKYKNRIFSLIAVMVFIPMFSFNAFAAIQSPILAGYVNSFEFVPVPTQSGERVLNVRFSLDGTTLASYNSVYDNVNFNYNNSSLSSVSSIYVGTDSASFDFDYVPELYDYYFYLSFHSNEIQDSFSFYPSNVRLREYTSISDYNWVTPNYKVYHNNVDGNHKGFSVLINVPFSNNSAVNVIRIDDTINKGSVASNIAIQGVILAFEKDTSEESVNAIVNAINNQTSALGGKIDDTNDYINFGNGSTGGIVSDNNSAVDNLNEVVSEYHATEQQFFDDFTANQQAINSDIVGWSWGGLVNCANWVGETMTDYYNNMGDFRQYIIYPLMLGIVLFFLGRGGAIIGHLFRKPTQSTVNIESTSFKRGNTRYTTTTTSKKGGVFRK